MLKINDLKEQGLSLSKMDAQEMHSIINEIAQRGADGDNMVFPGTVKADDTGGKSEDEPFKQKKLTKTSLTPEIAAAGFKLGDMYPPIPVKTPVNENQNKTIVREITEEDLVNNPELVTQGLKVGDSFEFPVVE